MYPGIAIVAVVMMAKRYLLPFAPGLLILAVGVSASIAGPAARTQAYFALQRQWAAHWPLEHGVALPRIIQPALLPFTPVWVQVEPGIKMLLDPADYVSHTILETGEWERDSWAAIREHLASGATFVDVGAHIGYYSLQAERVVSPAGRVIAIEPNPETVRKLRANIQASQARTITVEPMACADKESTLDLFAGPATNSGETSLSRANASHDGQSLAVYQVRARPLDAILEETGVTRVDAVKIDVEGAEVLVLKGAEKTLARFHPAILVEVVDQQLRTMGSSREELVRFLSDRGYTARGAFQDNIEFVANAGAARRN